MRKIIVGAQVSIDGVMQGPGGPTEDPTGNFRFGGWAMPYFDEAAGADIMGLFEDYELLLGRKTYEIFAAYWPYYDESAPDGAIATSLNRARKYVVSGSGKVDTGWENTVLLRDVEAVKRIKAEDGPDLLTQGSTKLAQALLSADLVDQISLYTVPVVLGTGKKLFADGSAPHAFKLTRSLAAPSGMLIAHYQRDGEVKVGDTAMDKPSAREAARQERMKREG